LALEEMAERLAQLVLLVELHILAFLRLITFILWLLAVDAAVLGLIAPIQQAVVEVGVLAVLGSMVLVLLPLVDFQAAVFSTAEHVVQTQ
jgi:hypothetical protein